MHKGVFDEHGVHAVLLRAQPREPLPVDEGLQRVEVRHQHIDPHVELVPVQQQGVGDVLLHHDVVGVAELRQVVDHFYASAARFADGLHDPVVAVAVADFLFVEFYAELGELFGQVVGEGQEVKRDFQHLAEGIEVLVQQVLSGEIFVERIVVDSLPN